MPRQDVPYGGAICRLRERIAEIFDKLNEKLHSINGVEGDGQGNVVLRSDSAALTIADDQLQHEIVLDLDTSQLPAADVNSVNNQVGVVILTADDIPSDNGDVQTDLDNLANADIMLQGNINAEALARQNADSTLQTNINTVTASLPAAAAAAVTADPTVAQLVTDMAGKVDLTDVSTVETPNTIAKRNGSGRLVAADPASGATDKTLTTANWISQTGSGAPNNLLHTTGNESKSGFLTMEDFIYSKHKLLNTYSTDVSLGRWIPIYEITITGQTFPQATFLLNNRLGGVTLMNVNIRSGVLHLVGLLAGTPRTAENLFRASTEDDDKITIWMYFATNDGVRSECLTAYGSNSQMPGSNIIPLSGTKGYTIDASGYTDENSVVHTFTRYAEMNQ